MAENSSTDICQQSKKVLSSSSISSDADQTPKESNSSNQPTHPSDTPNILSDWRHVKGHCASGAMYWYGAGLAVLPFLTGTMIPAVEVRQWLKDYSPDKILLHWQEYPEHGVGVILGDSMIVFIANNPEAVTALSKIETNCGVTPGLIVKTEEGEERYYRRSGDTVIKSDFPESNTHPIVIKTDQDMMILPPVQGKSLLVHTAEDKSDLPEITQEFIDAVQQHNGEPSVTGEATQATQDDTPATEETPPPEPAVTNDAQPSDVEAPSTVTPVEDAAPAPPKTGDDPPSALEAVQQRFGLVKISGKFFSFDRTSLNARTHDGTAQKLILSGRSDGELSIVRFLRAEYPHAEAKKIITEFWSSPQTVCYDGVEFNPKGNSVNTLNLWTGPTITPKPGPWPLIQAFLLDIICSGDQKSYLYLLQYIAHALQRPWEKPGVMIILIGGQGIGKGTFANGILRKIWTATYIQVNNIDAVTGNFNATLERAFIVFMDEALFAGNHSASDRLKSLVTEPLIHLNEKYQPARQIMSYHRFIAATNADHFKKTDRDDRRDFTLRVSESRKGDLAYWEALNHEIDNGGVEALVHDLRAMDLSSFKVRNKPDTKELLEQKMYSLDPYELWWHDCLYRGGIVGENQWPSFVKTADAIEGIMQFTGGKVYRKPVPILISKALMKFCPSAKSGQKQVSKERHRGFELPSLQQARTEFETYIGGAVDWPEDV